MAENILRAHETIGPNTYVSNLVINNPGNIFLFYYSIVNYVAPTDSTLPGIYFYFEGEDGYLNSSELSILVTENIGYTMLDIKIPLKATVVDIYIRGDFTATSLQLYSQTELATVEVDKGLEYSTDGKLNFKASTAEGSFLTTSKTVEGAINEVFQSAADAFNLFATSIRSKGGVVSKAGANYTKTEINNGILSIPNSGVIFINAPDLLYLDVQFVENETVVLDSVTLESLGLINDVLLNEGGILL